MNDDLSDRLTVLHEAIMNVPEPDGTHLELAEGWLALKTLHDLLGVFVTEWSTTAGRVLADVEYGRGLRLPDGTVVHHEQSWRDRWDAARTVSQLTQHVVDPAGELIEAVPVAVLADVIPGWDGTSSRWKVTGLVAHGVDVDSVREREAGPVRLAKGPKR